MAEESKAVSVALSELVTPKSLLKRFYLLQEERIQTYHLFDEGHVAYLKGAPNYNFPMYRQLVHEITETFKKISEEIILIEDHLRSQHKLQSVAKIITVLQQQEKLKLEQVVKLQMAKQNVLDHPADDDHAEHVAECKHSLAEIGEKISEQMEELKYEAEDILTEGDTEGDTKDDTEGDPEGDTVVER